jgi:Na+-driven multidrug efflux pump
MAFTLFSILIGIMVIKYGNPVFAAQRVGTQIEQFTWMISGGFQTALAVFVGKNFGAKNYERIRKGTILLSAILIPYSLVVMVIFIFQSEFLIRLFLDSEETIGFGTDYLRIISLSQPFMMIEGIGTGLFNGVGKTKVPSITGMVGNALRIPLSLFLSIGLAQYGIWWAMNISDGLKGGVLVVGGILLLVKLEKKKVLKGPSEEITQNVA